MASSKFEALITEASRKAEQLKQLEANDMQLSIKGYLRAIEKELGGDGDRASRVEAVMNTPEGQILRVPYARLERFLREWKKTSVPKKLRGYFTDESFAVLCSNGWKMSDLFWLAARDEAAVRPQLFGSTDDREAHQNKIDSIRADLNRLFAEIKDSWSTKDIEVDRSSGAIRFRCTRNEVELHPVDHLPQRLVDWWTTNSAVRKAA
jgi:hypothetical protein